MSVALSYDFSDNERIQAMLNALSDVDLAELADLVAREAETQTRRRITEEKTSPEGAAWPEWSEAYAKTRKSGQDLLQSEGLLLASIRGAGEGHAAVWGSNRVYAALQNFGGEAVGINVPAREFLGLSAENREDIEHLVEDFFAGVAA